MSLRFSSEKKIDNFLDPYIIVEVNSSHFGSTELAKEMITTIKNSGANCVKFQSWSENSLYSSTYYEANPIAKRFVSKFSLSEGEIIELSDFSHEQGLDFASTPYSMEEAVFLVEKCSVPFIKIASMELNNLDFLEELSKLNVPLVLSTGMGELSEIQSAVSLISKRNTQLAILHCNSIYPTPFEDVNLSNIKMLQDEFVGYPIGFSDHTLGIEASIAASAMGAAIIEKHFTLDKSRVGMDNQMAIEVDDLNALVSSVRNVNSALGIYDRVLTQGELNQRKNMRRSIVTKRAIYSGETISREDIVFKRPGNGISIEELANVIGKTVLRDLQADVVIQPSDMSE